MISATLFAMWLPGYSGREQPARDSVGGHALFDKAGEETLGDIDPSGGLPSILDGVVQIVAVFFPVARFRHPGKARVKGGFDQTVLPVFESGFKGILNLVVGQRFGVVSAGAEEVEGIADNHDRRLAATAAIIFFERAND
jgi:hypothetical protein